jgi:hypothetical protein
VNVNIPTAEPRISILLLIGFAALVGCAVPGATVADRWGGGDHHLAIVGLRAGEHPAEPPASAAHQTSTSESSSADSLGTQSTELIPEDPRVTRAFEQLAATRSQYLRQYPSATTSVDQTSQVESLGIAVLTSSATMQDVPSVSRGDWSPAVGIAGPSAQ